MHLALSSFRCQCRCLCRCHRRRTRCRRRRLYRCPRCPSSSQFARFCCFLIFIRQDASALLRCPAARLVRVCCDHCARSVGRSLGRSVAWSVGPLSAFCFMLAASVTASVFAIFALLFSASGPKYFVFRLSTSLRCYVFRVSDATNGHGARLKRHKNK